MASFAACVFCCAPRPCAKAPARYRPPASCRGQPFPRLGRGLRALFSKRGAPVLQGLTFDLNQRFFKLFLIPWPLNPNGSSVCASTMVKDIHAEEGSGLPRLALRRVHRPRQLQLQLLLSPCKPRTARSRVLATSHNPKTSMRAVFIWFPTLLTPYGPSGRWLRHP